jgi:hypothetical protein
MGTYRLAVVVQALRAVEDQAVVMGVFFAFRVSHETSARAVDAGQRALVCEMGWLEAAAR